MIFMRTQSPNWTPAPWWTTLTPPAFWGGGAADPERQPATRRLEIDHVIVDGTRAPVTETVVRRDPFFTVTLLQRADAAAASSIVVTTPMSGHYAVLMRDLVQALTARHRVFVLDWVNARHVPMSEGAFGFEDNIEAVISALACAGPAAHLVGVCQSATPAAAAAVALHQSGDARRPASLSLLGGPINVDAAPTKLSRLLAATPVAWLDEFAIKTTSRAHPGAGRRVYPAQTHHRNLLTHLTKHCWQLGPLSRKIYADDGADPARFPFLQLYSSVKDLPAAAFLESIAAIYQERRLPRGVLSFQGERLRPHGVRDMALLTVEAEHDDVVAPGQTKAAHAVLSGLPDRLRRHLSLKGVGHFSLFHGQMARAQVAAAIGEMVGAAEAAGPPRADMPAAV